MVLINVASVFSGKECCAWSSNFSLAGVGRVEVAVEKQVFCFLKFCAHKDVYRMNASKFGLTISAFHAVVERILRLVLKHMVSRYIVWPDSERQKELATYHEQRFSFPGVIGYLDGTHFHIKRPQDQPQRFYNNRYRKHTIVMQCTALDDLSLSSVDVGSPGRFHDARVFRNSDLCIDSGDRIDSLFDSADYHLLCDQAYPQKSYLVKPYRDTGDLTRGQRNFNKLHASIRVKVEQAIGLLKGRWKRLHYLDTATPMAASEIVLACAVCHNFCIKHQDLYQVPAEDVAEELRGAGGGEGAGDRRVLGIDAGGVEKRERIMRQLPRNN